MPEGQSTKWIQLKGSRKHKSLLYVREVSLEKDEEHLIQLNCF